MIISYSLSGTEPGHYEGVFGDGFKVMAGSQDVTANYELVEKHPGTLTIGGAKQSSSDSLYKPVADKAAAKAVSESVETGHDTAQCAMVFAGVALAAGAVALIARRKHVSCR